MIAEVIEKGDATFTIKYSAENGQEAMMISMMAIGRDENCYLSANGMAVNVGSVNIAVLKSLSEKFAERP